MTTEIDYSEPYTPPASGVAPATWPENAAVQYREIGTDTWINSLQPFAWLKTFEYRYALPPIEDWAGELACELLNAAMVEGATGLVWPDDKNHHSIKAFARFIQEHAPHLKPVDPDEEKLQEVLDLVSEYAFCASDWEPEYEDDYDEFKENMRKVLKGYD